MTDADWLAAQQLAEANGINVSKLIKSLIHRAAMRPQEFHLRAPSINKDDEQSELPTMSEVMAEVIRQQSVEQALS